MTYFVSRLNKNTYIVVSTTGKIVAKSWDYKYMCEVCRGYNGEYGEQ